MLNFQQLVTIPEHILSLPSLSEISWYTDSKMSSTKSSLKSVLEKTLSIESSL